MPAHNKRYIKPLRSPVSAFRNLTSSEIHNLDVILASRYTRTILNGNAISYKNTQYIPIDSHGQIVLIPGGTTVVITDNGICKKLIWNNNVYDVVKFKDGKTSSPPASHPWRRHVHRTGNH